MTHPPEHTPHETEDVWTGDRSGPDRLAHGIALSGQWWAAAPFRQYVQSNPALWSDLSEAFARQEAAPGGFLGVHANTIVFVVIHHPLSSEIGIWVAPAWRGRGHASGWLRAAMRSFPWPAHRQLLLAHCPAGDSAAACALQAAGFRDMAKQHDRRILCLYRPT